MVFQKLKALFLPYAKNFKIWKKLEKIYKKNDTTVIKHKDLRKRFF